MPVVDALLLPEGVPGGAGAGCECPRGCLRARCRCCSSLGAKGRGRPLKSSERVIAGAIRAKFSWAFCAKNSDRAKPVVMKAAFGHVASGRPQLRAVQLRRPRDSTGASGQAKKGLGVGHAEGLSQQICGAVVPDLDGRARLGSAWARSQRGSEPAVAPPQPQLDLVALPSAGDSDPFVRM